MSGCALPAGLYPPGGYPRDPALYAGRIEGWNSLGSAALAKRFSSGFSSRRLAIAHAVWAANKLVKQTDRPAAVRRRFYGLKERWVQRHGDVLCHAHFVRNDGEACGNCFGSGRLSYDSAWGEDTGGLNLNPCPACQGTGSADGRHLFVHEFEVEGMRFSFHSYSYPSKVSPCPIGGREIYHRPLTREQEDRLLLPLPGLMRIVEWDDECHGQGDCRWNAISDLTWRT